MKYKDYYKILGVDRKASTDEIKKAYRRMARKYHPDVSKEAGAEEKFKDVNEANDVLSDSEKRAAYDQLGYYQPGQDFRPPPDWGQRFNQGGFDPSNLGGMDFGDLFSQLFGAQGASAGFRGMSKGRDLEAEVSITLEEAFHGTERSLSVAGNPSVKVRIPPGILPGRRLRVPGKGGQSTHGKAGDLYLRVNVAPHPLYRLEGRDIYLDTPIAPWEAVLGASIEVPTLSGKVRLKVPAGTRSGQKLRLAGRGMPEGRQAGDFYVLLQIAPPADLSGEERALYEQLARLARGDPRAHFPK